MRLSTGRRTDQLYIVAAKADCAVNNRQSGVSVHGVLFAGKSLPAEHSARVGIPLVQDSHPVRRHLVRTTSGGQHILLTDDEAHYTELLLRTRIDD